MEFRAVQALNRKSNILGTGGEGTGNEADSLVFPLKHEPDS